MSTIVATTCQVSPSRFSNGTTHDVIINKTDTQHSDVSRTITNASVLTKDSETVIQKDTKLSDSDTNSSDSDSKINGVSMDIDNVTLDLDFENNVVSKNDGLKTSSAINEYDLTNNNLKTTNTDSVVTSFSDNKNVSMKTTNQVTTSVKNDIFSKTNGSSPDEVISARSIIDTTTKTTNITKSGVKVEKVEEKPEIIPIVKPEMQVRTVEDNVNKSTIKETVTTVSTVIATAGHMSSTSSCSSSSIESSSESESGVSSDGGDEDIMETGCSKKDALLDLFIDMFDESIATLNEHTLCSNTRTKQINHIAKWMESCTQSRRLLLMTGHLGTGKTCISSHVCRTYSSQLLSVHSFSPIVRHPDMNNLPYVITSIVYRLIDNISGYSESLPSVTECEKLLNDGDVSSLFKKLLIEPLDGCGGSGLFSDSSKLEEPSSTKLIVIDGVDLSHESEQQEFAQFIESYASVLPKWLRVLITIRSDSPILSLIDDNICILELKKTNDNYVDMKRMLKEPMLLHMDRISVDGGLNQLAKKSEGLYLCGELLAKFIAEINPDVKIAMREIGTMFPANLNILLLNTFSSFKSLSSQHYDSVVSRLSLARAPLDPSCFYDLWDCSESRVVMVRLKPLMSLIRVDADGCLSFVHPYISDWVFVEEYASNCTVSLPVAQQHMASLMVTWLAGVKSDKEQPPSSSYALLHGIYHLCEASQQQSSIAASLCDLRLIIAKLLLPSIRTRHVLDDYHHSHQTFGADDNVVMCDLREQLTSHPRLLQRVEIYERFILSQRDIIESCLNTQTESISNCILQQAASYHDIPEIKNKGREFLEKCEPWLECVDLSAEETQFSTITPVGGTVRVVDISPDGSTIAVVCKDRGQVTLNVYNTATHKLRHAPIDIKSLSERFGIVASFLTTGNTLFVGSFSTIINVNTGKPMASGLDIRSMQMKDKYSIECSNSSPKYLICGLTTLPWGGRTLYLPIYDIKLKKCIRNLEVLHVRTSGNSSSCMKACAVASDKPLVCACIREGTKPQVIHFT